MAVGQEPILQKRKEGLDMFDKMVEGTYILAALLLLGFIIGFVFKMISHIWRGGQNDRL